MQYIAFLRAINVSGTRIIKMEDLRTIWAGLPGVKNIKTYIQSGNVLFETKQTDTDKLSAKIEKHLEESLGFGVEVFVRTAAELQAVVDNNPFAAEEHHTLYITFLRTSPDPDKSNALLKKASDIDRFFIHKKEVYAFVRKTGEKSLFSNMLLEKQLKQQATGRNLNTIQKILAML